MGWGLDSEREVPRHRRQDGEQTHLFGLDLQVPFQQFAFVVKEQEVGVGAVVQVVNAEHPTAFHFPVFEVLFGEERGADVCAVVGHHAVPVPRPIDVCDVPFEEVTLDGKGEGVACGVDEGGREVPPLARGPVHDDAEVVAAVKFGWEGVTVVQILKLAVGFAPCVADPAVQLAKLPLQKELGPERRAFSKDEVVVRVGAYVLVRACVLGVFHQVVQFLVVDLHRGFPFAVGAQIHEVPRAELTAALGRNQI